MKIIVCDIFSRQVKSFHCQLQDTIFDLKEKIAQFTGIPHQQLSLQFEQKWLLKSSLSLYDYNIREGSIIYYRMGLKLVMPVLQAANVKVEKEEKEVGLIDLKKPRVQAKREKKQFKNQLLDQQQNREDIKQDQKKELFFALLKRSDIRDEVIQILNKQEIYSREQLKDCSQQMLISVGITLGQILKLKKI